jgi:hypothetical protein
MSNRTPHQRGKLELAGAIDDLIAQIERERRNRPPAAVTYDTWVATVRSAPEGESQAGAA